MKTIYAVKKIRIDSAFTPEQYNDIVNRAPEHYCNGLAEVRAYCGGNLRRCGHGYIGNNGIYEFIAYRVK